ncbi:MAG: hypothetical protein CMK44_00620 [Porticoccus sp.]|nr:hypothetical protein [Porticoccus sp.]|tara:strand:+ start:356 stop:1432 length:1077 start_codon:yes stop_codon:yes gene_type:complete
MYPYLLSYLLICFLTIIDFYQIKIYLNHQNKIKFIVIAYLSFFMGFKYYVGGDWGTYINYFNAIEDYKLNLSDFNNDLGYYLFNLLIKKLGLNFSSINFFSSIISLLGIHLLANFFKRYWIFFLVLTPYFIFVILMGYTRQSIAIGLFFIGLSFLFKGKNIKNFFLFYILIIISCFFHKSSIIFFLIPLLTIRINSYSLSIILHMLILFTIVIIFLILNDRFLVRLEYFISNQYSSIGGYIRIGIIFLICSFNFIILGKADKNIYTQKLINKLNLLSISIALMILLIPSTVIVDRFLLYFYFIIPIMFIKLIDISKNNLNKLIILYSIIVFGFIFMIVWFNFATNSNSWLPYRNYLFI